MSTGAATKRPLTQLNHEIEEAEAEAARLDSEQRSIAKEVSKASRRVRYLSLAQWIRRPAASFPLWPMAVIFFGSLLVGIFAMILIHLPTNSYPLAFFAFLLGTVAGVGLFASLIYYPADDRLPMTLDMAGAAYRLTAARLQEKSTRVTEVKQRLAQLIEERRDQIASGKLQKAALLQRPWKTMQPAEWQDFIVEVCRTHGANVERTGGRDDGCLVADYGWRRVAILTDAEERVVASSTIQKALAAKDQHGCSASAVIVNRRFTGAAQDFAQRNGCAAIGTAEFPDFVLGKLEF